MLHKSIYVEDKKFEEASKYKMKHESDIVDVWEVAGTEQTTESGAMKQCLAILVLWSTSLSNWI